MTPLPPRSMTQAEMLDEIRTTLAFGPTAELREMHYSALVYIARQLAQPHGGGRANIASAERLAQVLDALWHEMDYVAGNEA
jgi:hypothetical protein